jgi:hypothetical protein
VFETHAATMADRLTRIKECIDLHSRKPTEDEMEKDCAICMEQFKVGDKYLTPSSCSAGHLFHAECLKQWVDMRNFTCPMCRERLSHN